MPDELIPYKDKCQEILYQCRLDKIKHVRESALQAYNVLLEMEVDEN